MINSKLTRHRTKYLILATCLAAIGACAQGGPVRTVRCVPFSNVQVADGLWSARLEANRKTTIPASFKYCRDTKRIENFVVAAGKKEGKFSGLHFNDSDVYKIVEGAAYVLKAHPDAKLEKYVDGLIAKIAAAQQSDGYLDTYFTIARTDQRFKHIQHSPRHELYCMGHLVEAGAAHYEVTGKKSLLTVAVKLADHIGSVFGPDKRHEVPEHQQLESALIRLYRATGEKRHLELGQFFIDQRGAPGRRKNPRPYSQDHMPVRKQSEAVGHAVRAMYNCMGMADLYMEIGDAELLAACRRLWKNTTNRKMYVTGGVGATGRGEAFGKNYELPNESAYAETCAAIGLVFFAHRMWQISPDGEYIDVLERALYNGVLGGISLAGDEFFYVNRLASKGGRGAARRKWFSCACCPSNVCRFIPVVPGYAYGHRGEELYVNLYLPGSAKVKMAAQTVTLVQQTKYPWDGEVGIRVEPAKPAEFTVKLRIPGWARGKPVGGDLYRYANAAARPVGLQVNGSFAAMKIDKGYAAIRRKWTSGDTISLALPMPVRRVLAHEKVTADAGRVALERGPVVYCAEGKDNADKALEIVLDDGVALKSEYRKGLLGGVSVVTGKLKGGSAFVAVPYFARANRGQSEMNVWLKRTETVPPSPAKK